MADIPFAEIRERSLVEHSYPPLLLRADAVASADEHIIPDLDPVALGTLASDKPWEEKTQDLFEHFSGDAEKTLESVLPLIEQPTIVDAVTRLPANSLPTAAMDQIGEWKQTTLAALRTPFPDLPDVHTEVDMILYSFLTLPVRPGQEQLQGKLKESMMRPTRESAHFFGTNYRRLYEPTRDAATIVGSATRIALDIASHTPTHAPTVLAAIDKGLQAQDAWSVIGLTTPEDAITHSVLTAIRTSYIPGAATIAVDTLFRRIDMDQPISKAMLESPWFHEQLVASIEPFASAAFKTNPYEAADRIGTYTTIRGVIADIAEMLAIRPELHGLPYPVAGDRVNYFGTTFHITDLPPGTTSLQELTFGVLMAADEQGHMTNMYRLDPRVDQGQGTHPEATTQTIRPETMMLWGKTQGESVPRETIDAFLSALPQLKQHLQVYLRDRISAETFPLADYYHLWRYEQTQPPDKQAQLYRFLQRYGASGMATFRVGEHSGQAVADIIDFALRESDEESFAITMLGAYRTLTEDAWATAFEITGGKNADETIAFRDMLLVRAKSFLMAAAHLDTTFPDASEDERYQQEQYIIHAIQYHHGLLAALIVPEVAEQLDIPYESVQQLYTFYRSDDPDSRAVFHSAMELWFEKYRIMQQNAPYAGKVEELTNEFYTKLWQEEQKNTNIANETTADTLLEVKRYTADIRHDLSLPQGEPGRLPRESSTDNPVRVGFLGMYTGERVEQTLVEYMRSHTTGYEFYGFDIQLPPTQPAGVTYDIQNMATIGFDPRYEDAFTRLYAVWSPYMDVLEFSEMEKTAESLSRGLRDGGELIIDIHFPFGSHSYEQLLKEYHASHPTEPEGMMEKQFGEAEKPFFASEPRMLTWMFGQYGMELVNMPTDPQALAAFCAEISTDDSTIPAGPQENMNKQAVYQTQAGANRATYIFRKTGTKEDRIFRGT